MVESDRIIMFLVACWYRETQVNRGFRIKMNSAGPYRWTSFSPVCRSKYLEILAFEQTFKTANHIANGWWKGGATFWLKGNQIMKWSVFVKVSWQSCCISRTNTDVPTDIGVGGRGRIMFSEYKEAEKWIYRF
jgi:glutamate dehydrogenase/leucine dehydrogenase